MRRFLPDLTALVAVTAACGLALTRALSSPASHPALMLEPMVVTERRTPLDDAIRVLRNATEFASAPVGYGGDVPATVVAWLTILYDPAAESHFLELVRDATPAGRAYALTGLRATNLSLFEGAARLFRRSPTPVNTVFGHIRSTTTTARIVADLDHGAWIGELVSASRVRYFGDLPWPQ